MKLTVFGAGYVGLVTGACLAELGNDVIVVDIDKNRVENLKKGIIPIFESGLSEMIKKNVNENRLSFTLDSKDAVRKSEVIFIAVGTPSRENGSTDFTYVLNAAKTIGKHLNSYKVIVSKSTVPVGTAKKIKREIKNNTAEEIYFDVVSNPEFLAEGNAVRDFMAPDRIILGSDSKKASEIMKELYSGIVRVNRPLFITDVKSAEIIKYAANSMLACRISFMNQLSRLCDVTGANIKDIAKGIGMDKRIGSRFLQAGVGYGGSCFPKDVRSLAMTLKLNNLSSELIEAITSVNDSQKLWIVHKIKNILKSLNKKKIGIWGLAFKPKTDDIREAPSLTIINELLLEGAEITAYDPEAMPNIKKELGNKINYADNIYEIVNNSDCLILITEWDEFRNPDWNKIKKLMKGNLIVDGRNIYDPKVIKSHGFEHIGVGR